MRDNTRIVIEPASNGYIVTCENEEETDVRVFLRRRQVMYFLGKQIEQLKTKSEEIEE